MGTSGCALLRGDPIEIQYESGITPSGVIWMDQRHGDGPRAHSESEVTIDYAARLSDGTAVDSTYTRGTPITFSLLNPPLPGFREGLSQMQVGGLRILIVPPDLAFGTEGIPGRVPKNATIEFEIELLAAGE